MRDYQDVGVGVRRGGCVRCGLSGRWRLRPDCASDAYGDLYPGADGDPDFYSDAGADAYSDCDAGANCDTYSDRNARADRDSYAGAYPYSYAGGYGYPYPYSYSDAHTDFNSFGSRFVAQLGRYKMAIGYCS